MSARHITSYLIITDYLTFRLFEGENFNKLIELIRTFSRYNGKP